MSGALEYDRQVATAATSDDTSLAQVPDERRRAVLRARARDLARRNEAAGGPADGIEVVQFLLANEHYAVETIYIQEVYPLRELTPVPCTPPFVLGIISVRGQILPVLDLRRLFDLPATGMVDLNRVILLRHGDATVGLLAEAIMGVRIIPSVELQPPLPTMSPIGVEYFRGITPDRLLILDAAVILSSERIIVNEEVDN